MHGHPRHIAPQHFLLNSALIKNLEQSLIQEYGTINRQVLMAKIKKRCLHEPNHILRDLYLQALIKFKK